MSQAAAMRPPRLIGSQQRPNDGRILGRIVLDQADADYFAAFWLALTK
jgi:hypothetical protein